MSGFFGGFFGPSPAERQLAERRERERQAVRDYGRRGALEYLRDTQPGYGDTLAEDLHGDDADWE